ncbi:MAG: 23S rRNA (guanosine(2251)-2'-O)-methyltransferase RlmB [Bernardetiaceae bacterium]|jgi:23S rRNA (guanosine2251-2'-O)-methyltransferase|nr:23S rRNA (guanosine(2251)-2'-O)-methyltransferase RlmB [Bernardetiaceae bacterium]
MEKRPPRRAPAPNPADVVFGIHPVQEVLESGKEIERVLLQKEVQNPTFNEIMAECRRRHIPIMRVPGERLDRVTRKNHQGIMAFIAAVQYASLDHVISTAYAEGRSPLVLVLDRITDVGNFGAITRTAECTGVDAIVIPDRGAARINSDAYKTSAGALGHVAVCREHSLVGTIHFLKSNGLQMVACTEKAQNSFYEVDYTLPTAIVMGSEEDGIAPEVLALCEREAKIPVLGKIGSLNVSVATGVVLYEAIRQKIMAA